MSLEQAMRLTEILLALAILQQSTEHLIGPKPEKYVFLARIGFCLLLLSGVQSELALGGLVALSLVILKRYQGPYNGGSDRMGLLILWSLAIAQTVPSPIWQERIYGYLAVQVILSYFISGKVKLTKPEWRNGQALRDVFLFSAYPVSENLRSLANRPAALRLASCAVILSEVLFPLALISQPLLFVALAAAAVFHLANACLFGLNRFFWTWIASYPSILWLQARLM